MKHNWFHYRLLKISGSVMLGGSLLASSGAAYAQISAEQYTDVQAGVWYEQAADALLGAEALSSSETRLRPNDLATRAEVAKLLVHLNDVQLSAPASSSFTDVPRSAWYYSYMETAAQAGWLRGDANCYGQGRSVCNARPAAPVNRAEMAIILERAFALSHAGSAPLFPDNQDQSRWYFLPIQIAADNCILQGDDFTGLVRPAAYMNRAEMIVMFYRGSLNLDYGEDCGSQAEQRPDISGVTAPASRRVRLTFNVDLDPDRIDDASAYTIERSGEADIDVDSVTVMNTRTVELVLETSMSANVTYRVHVDNMLTERGRVFDDFQSFVFEVAQAEPFIDSVTVQSSGVLRVRFSEDVLRTRADDSFRYTLAVSPGGATTSIESVNIINDRTVDLLLDTTLESDTNYRLYVNSMLTEDMEEFDDDYAFVSSTVTLPMIEEVQKMITATV